VRKLEAIRQAGAIVQEIILRRWPVKTWTAHCGFSSLRAERVASGWRHSVHEKTAQSIFSPFKFISALAEEAYYLRSMAMRAGPGTMNRIHAKGIRYVVDLMVES